jgi:hypothetical protein
MYIKLNGKGIIDFILLENLIKLLTIFANNYMEKYKNII